MPNAWLKNTVITGIQKLVVLRLPNTPPESAIVATASVWINVLQGMHVRWEQHLDQTRIEQAFRVLCARCDKWPAPKHLIDALPVRVMPAPLPPPKIDKKTHQSNIKKLRAVLQSGVYK